MYFCPFNTVCQMWFENKEIKSSICHHTHTTNPTLSVCVCVVSESLSPQNQVILYFNAVNICTKFRSLPSGHCRFILLTDPKNVFGQRHDPHLWTLPRKMKSPYCCDQGIIFLPVEMKLDVDLLSLRGNSFPQHSPVQFRQTYNTLRIFNCFILLKSSQGSWDCLGRLTLYLTCGWLNFMTDF